MADPDKMDYCTAQEEEWTNRNMQSAKISLNNLTPAERLQIISSFCPTCGEPLDGHAH